MPEELARGRPRGARANLDIALEIKIVCKAVRGYLDGESTPRRE
jgi:hypothetical protein